MMKDLIEKFLCDLVLNMFFFAMKDVLNLSFFSD